MRYLAWFVGVLVLSVLVASCGGDEQPRKSGYEGPCGSADECAANLVCRFGRCRQACDGDGECSAGACLRDAAHPKGVCAIARDQGCSATLCAPKLTCAADDVCRPLCASAGDCAAPDVCEQGACMPQSPSP